jgi:large repetitive protein
MPNLHIPSNVFGKARLAIVLWLFLFLSAVLILPQTTSAAGAWKFTGSMNTTRAYHTATLLADGRVLVAGGVGLNSAEIYDPATASWTPTKPMNSNFAYHTATLLRSGQVLAVCGNRFELYNPGTETWTATGYLHNNHNMYGTHTATLLSNGKVLVVGGTGGYTPNAEIYDPNLGTWTVTSDTGFYVQPDSHTATLSNGQVLVAGGFMFIPGGPAPTFLPLNFAQLYNAVAATWTKTASLKDYRMGHTATLLPNGNVLVAGGTRFWNYDCLPSAEVYNPAAATWSYTGLMYDARKEHTATLLSNDKVMVAGGYNGSKQLSGTEIYDLVSGTWAKAGALNTARAGHTATRLNNDQVLVTGGSNSSNGALKSAELYNDTTGVSPGIFQLLLGD